MMMKSVKKERALRENPNSNRGNLLNLFIVVLKHLASNGGTTD